MKRYKMIVAYIVVGVSAAVAIGTLAVSFAVYLIARQLLSDNDNLKITVDHLEKSLAAERGAQGELRLAIRDLDIRLVHETASLRTKTMTEIARLDTRLHSGLEGVQGSLQELSGRQAMGVPNPWGSGTPIEVDDLKIVNALGEGDRAFAAGNFADAAAAYAEVVSINPKDQDAVLRMHAARYRAVPVDADLAHIAEASFEQVLAVDPTHAMALEQLAFIRAEAGDWLAASVLYERRIALGDVDSDVFARAGYVHGFLDNDIRPAECLSRAANMSPADAEYQFAAAQAYDRAGAREEAIHYYLSCLKVQPNHAGALRGLKANGVEMPHNGPQPDQ